MLIHDPAGPPNPVEAGFGLGELFVTVVAGGVFLLILLAIATPTMGATRSTQLKWQERQQQMEAARESGL
jgi:hypothetical protein